VNLLKVCLPEGAHVLLLEDSEMRIKWFEKRVPNLHVCRTVPEFKDYFTTRPTVDFLFLDHDLGEGNGDGVEACQFVADTFSNNSRWGLIHSWNRAGARRMMDILVGVRHIPFGEFEIQWV
jgi:hypothetical protein